MQQALRIAVLKTKSKNAKNGQLFAVLQSVPVVGLDFTYLRAPTSDAKVRETFSAPIAYDPQLKSLWQMFCHSLLDIIILGGQWA